MNFLHVKNRARTTLASGVLIDDGLLTVLDGDVFPASGDFHVTIEDEILNVTERDNDTMSVQRAQEDTSASTHTISGYVELRITAGIITEIQNEINAHEIDISTHGATDIADVSDIAVEANLSTNTQDAISKRHTRQHSITATDDHTSTATSGKLLKADASGLPVDATNTDIQVSGAVVKSHTQNTDTDLDATFELTFEKVVNKNTTSGYVGLDGSALIPLAQIPTTLTGKDADTLDTYHAVSFEKVANKAAISGYCDLDGSTLVPLSRIPSTLTGKDADTLDSQHRVININVDHTHQTTGAEAGQLDHGLALTGLSDDDHTIYTLKSTLTEQGDIYIATASGTPATLHHATEGNFLQTGGHGENPSWVDHTGANDPHTGYLKETVVSGIGLPNITLSTVAAAGVAIGALASDCTIIAFDVTDPSTQAFGDSAVVGVATVAARRDHKHVIPANPVTAHVADPDPHTGYVKKYNFVTKIAAYNAVANDFIVVNTVSGVFNITLPIIQTAGISVYVKQLVDYENAVTILPSGLVTIDGGSSFAFERGGYEFISDGTNWLVI